MRTLAPATSFLSHASAKPPGQSGWVVTTHVGAPTFPLDCESSVSLLWLEPRLPDRPRSAVAATAKAAASRRTPHGRRCDTRRAELLDWARMRRTLLLAVRRVQYAHACDCRVES